MRVEKQITELKRRQKENIKSAKHEKKQENKRNTQPDEYIVRIAFVQTVNCNEQ